jgi:hypothetical protein
MGGESERERESKDLWGISQRYLRNTCGIPKEYPRNILGLPKGYHMYRNN